MVKRLSQYGTWDIGCLPTADVTADGGATILSYQWCEITAVFFQSDLVIIIFLLPVC